MAGPITWQNVGGGGNNNAVSLLNMGQQQIQQGLGALSGIIRENQQREQRNFQAARDNNTAKYLDAVASAGGVEALQNPETRANLEAMRSGFGAAIDRNATRNAIDTRVSGLQQQERVANAYADDQLERSQRGLIDQGMQLAQAGDMAGVQKLLAENQFLNEGKVAQDLIGIVDSGTRRQYAADNQARADRSEKRQIAQFQESMAAAAENRVIRNEARRDAKEERDFRRNTRVLDDAASQAQNILTQQESRNPWARTSTDPGKDAAALLKNMVDSKGDSDFDAWLSTNKSDRRAMTETITKLLSDGVEVDGQKYQIPPALLQQELQAVAGETHWFKSPAGNIEQRFKDMLSGNAGAAARAQVEQAQQTKANAREFINTLKQAKTQIGTSSSLDTSGIVAGLAALAGNQPISSLQNSPGLLPNASEDLKMK